MSCPADRIKDYFFGEAGDGEVEQHLKGCAECRAELERLRMTHAALRSVPDEEPPRRIAFVSDKVFEPRWWQRLWASGPRLGFASAAVLAGAIVFHGAWRPAPAPLPVPVAQQFDSAAFERKVAAEVDRRVAAAEARQAAKAASLVEAARKEFEFDRQADRAAVREAFTLLEKRQQMAYRMALNLEGGRP